MADLPVESQTLSPLPSLLRQGLIAVSVFGFLSFFFSVSLFLFLTYRLIAWRRKSGSQVSTNQFLVLIYNLLLADIQQAMAFLLNVSSLGHDAVEVGTTTCWAQGWFISTGNVASSVFILTIAMHTFMAVVKGYKLPSIWFYAVIVGLWIFIYAMAAAGVAMHPDDLYVRAGAWCWINDTYQTERLWLHYIWIFIAVFGSIILYTIIYLTLRRRSASPSTPTPHGATPLMLLYPTIYAVCTLPLAAGRIASMAGHRVPAIYFCVAGSMIACNGWLDVILYSWTRRSIVFSEAPPGESAGINTFWGMENYRLGNVTTIEGGMNNARMSRAMRAHSSSSTENLYGASAISIGCIKIDAEVHIRTEVDTYGQLIEMKRPERGVTRMESSERLDKSSWKTRSYEDL